MSAGEFVLAVLGAYGLVAIGFWCGWDCRRDVERLNRLDQRTREIREGQ